MACESADMHFVDDGSLERPARGGIVLPIIRAGIDDHAFERGGGIIPRQARRLAAPDRRPRDALSVRVQQQLTGVETQAVRRVEKSVDAEPVDLTRRDAGNEDMPVVVGPVDPRVECDHARRPCVVNMIEQG
jgi:hypothetical protein